MSKERNTHDISRSEGEGFGLQEMDAGHFLHLLLGRVERMFLGSANLEHLEDAVGRVVADMTKEERLRFDSIFRTENLNLTLDTHLKHFLGDEKWEELETLERNRILEYDQYRSEGTG
ncbi:MAG: hypothetical protein HYV90_00800 [Candidatus Woesebacteria bacterium]|nr:MAG: hypothetical protein HYV90_00800 [Candidatus Woesebacteria bacterium]